jgi:hypothetical protein
MEMMLLTLYTVFTICAWVGLLCGAAWLGRAETQNAANPEPLSKKKVQDWRRILRGMKF